MRVWAGSTRALMIAATATLSVGGSLLVFAAPAAAACTDNPVVCENQLPGTPAAEWDISGAGDDSIQGFATDISVNVGTRVDFKIKTPAADYSVDIYRLGWYGGTGARRVTSVDPSASLPQGQPACVTDPATALYDCGTWQVSAAWQVPSTAVSGVYIAKLTRPDNGDSSHIPFIVRNDASRSDIVFQTSDTTWQAYNTYGGSSFYTGPQGRALKLSYNRPFDTRSVAGGRDYLFGNEYPLIRFLERNGYDVSYMSGLDADRLGGLIKNHKTYLSVGHDEYWSGNQRDNVEAARDAGVNLAFLSGNEVYWKTRWEPSIDGSATSGRTLVCYKETWDNAKTDPSPEWTGTWRDPRFTPPSDGGLPENALTGTAYMSNFTDLAIQVSSDEGKRRLWRNTPAATLPAGQTRTLAPHTVGYESDEDLDNGFRPPGTIRLSTTTGPTDQYLRDFGTTVTPGTTTHHLTMYKAPSGALVFGAGTVQWTWGLDAEHDGDGAPADPVMQQATVNLLADMGAQPRTLMSGMVAATRSTDTIAPTVTITAPTAGTSLPNGTRATVTGTASDAGGVVAGVEVSTDGGSTWRVATGTSAWSFTYTQQGVGPTSVRVRATDDSLNTGPVASVATSSSCPCTVFGPSAPLTPDAGDGGAVELGVRIQPATAGWITGVKFYKSPANTGTHTGSLWSTTGVRLATGTFVNETPSGWQTLAFDAPVAVTAGTSYIASYLAPSGHYAADPWSFSAGDLRAPPLTAPRSSTAAPNGVFSLGAGFPGRTYRDTNYWVDVVFDDKDTYPPAVSGQTPLNGSTSVAAGVHPSATLSEAIDRSTLQFSLTDDQAGGTVTGSVGYDAATRTATFTPAGPLRRGGTFTASVRATDTSGNAMASPATWSFRTALPSPEPGVCPCGLWDDAAAPAVVSANDVATLELGVKFTADSQGEVSGIRFFKGPQNTGPHTGSLWSSTGQLLASATFGSESTTGWQTVTFSQPVAVTAGTTYIASYKTTTGYYSVTPNAFAGQGFSNPPLSVPAVGGVYRYGGGFPNSTSTTNYWVDVVYSVPPSVVPTVTSTSPAEGSTSVPVSSRVSATFSVPVQPSSPRITVSGPSGNVAGTSAHDTARRTTTFTPSQPLEAGTTYTVTVSGAKNLGGSPMTAPATSTFTTSGPSACPCTLFTSNAVPSTVDSGDGSAVSLGMKFAPSVDGYLTGMRFYKSSANTGTHRGSVWSATGTRLATVTFSAETAEGWQTAAFSQPVEVVAGGTYVVSYYAPSGHYSVDSGFFSATWRNEPLVASPGSSGNGLFAYGGDVFPTGSHNSSNYWVDAIFMPGDTPDTTPPTAAGKTPVDGATSVSVLVEPSAVLSEDVVPGSVQLSLRDQAGAQVPGSVAYDAQARRATIAPAEALARGATYTASLSATDSAGNVMASAATWSFRTALPTPAAGVCPCGIWDDSAAPQVQTVQDNNSVELGITLRATVDGTVTGVQFYKGPENTGTHSGSLWSASGERLATATFTDESSTGWQTVTFEQPVAVFAGTSYVASYRAPNGRYSASPGQLSAEGVDNPPLQALRGGGAYTYASGFPVNASGTNYWVDVVFVRADSDPPPDPPPADGTPPVVSSLAADGSGTTATVTWTTDEPATRRVDYGTSATSLSATAAAAGSGTEHSVPLTGLAPNTRYYYRVTSVDAAGNVAASPTTNPASHVPTVAPVTHTTSAHLNGTSSNTYVALRGDGEVVLAPTAAVEFSGSALPTGWSTTALVSGGSSSVANGLVTVSGARLSSGTTWTAGRSVAAAATLSAPNQRVGWGSTANTAVHASFTVSASRQLVAVVNDARGNSTSTAVPGSAIDQPRLYRVDWAGGTASFFVDEVQVASVPFAPTIALRTITSDTTVGGGDVIVDWLRVGPYRASGTYTSAVVDAGAPVGWDGVVWDATIPAGTTSSVQVRTGSTATPGTGWTAWTTAPAPGAVIGRSSRFLQYRIQMSSGGQRFSSPAVRSVQIGFHVL